jgi:hypothetical protein
MTLDPFHPVVLTIVGFAFVGCLFLFLFGDLITKAAKSFGGDE